jgi:hypothetical protein
VARAADLRNADLSNADLFSAALDCANLRGAILSSANLHGANLLDADLSGTRLIGANLRAALMSNVDLIHADLTDAELTNAGLSGANLTGAKLIGADLTNTMLDGTIFCDVDLAGALGLRTCKHFGPSIIDYRTLHKSGRLPLEFLRGVGLPDRLIESFPSIEYHSCLISYSSQDQDFADRIHRDLQNNGVRCWLAPEDVKLHVAIQQGLKLLLVLSEHSVASKWVEDEVKKALQEERTRQPKRLMLFPIRLDDAVMESKEAWAGLLRRDRNIGHFRHWKEDETYKKSFERVLRDLKLAAE